MFALIQANKAIQRVCTQTKGKNATQKKPKTEKPHLISATNRKQHATTVTAKSHKNTAQEMNENRKLAYN